MALSCIRVIWLLFAAKIRCCTSSSASPNHPVLNSSIRGGSSTTSNKIVVISKGLRNLGNTCYINAQLQCAFHIPYIRSLILSSDKGDEKIEPGLQALRYVFKNMLDESLSSARTAASPDYLCRVLGINPMEQQDTQEFWKLLLPQLKLQKLIDSYTGSYEDYIVACDGTDRSRRREEPFLDLSLEVDGFGCVMDSLRNMFNAPELLSVAEGNGWRPPVADSSSKNNIKVDALKGQLLRAQGLPPLLQLHLKRFRYDWQTDVTTKINSKFAFPEELDLIELLPPDSEQDNVAAKYELQSVIVHVGRYGSGHYYSYCKPVLKQKSHNLKVNEEPQQPQQWFRFDDDRVAPVSFDEVIADAYGGSASSSNTANHKSKNSQDSCSTMLQGRLLRWFRGRQSNSYGYGGRESCAYVLQYVRKSDIPLMYQ